MKVHATSVVAVRKDGCVAMASDGQVSVENTIFKSGARKVQRLYEGRVLAGFAGSAADAITLFEKFEGKLDEYKGNMQRAARELVREWRTDRVLRHLEALLIVADTEHVYLVSGAGDLIEPDEDVVGIGSGGAYAQAAGLALVQHSALSAEEIAREAIRIASRICVFTNDQVTVETLP